MIEVTQILMVIVQGGLSLAVGAFLLRERARSGRFDDLEKRLHTESRRAIDERFNLVMQEVQSITRRLETHAQRFEILAQRDSTIELRQAQSLTEIKDYLHKHCATREDITRLTTRLDQMVAKGAASQ